MVVGTATVELFVPASGSLKMKRSVVRRVRDRVRNKFNVSIAEVDHLDKWQRATLGIAFVANEGRFVDEVLGKVLREIRSEPELEVIDVLVERR
jgi:uncharacterized protein YlxP (DUF503 family)